jgi:hypothetical protein
MPTSDESVFCGHCGMPLKEDATSPVDKRTPCPSCGSVKRVVHATLGNAIDLKEKNRAKGHHSSGGKPFIEQVSGDDLHRMSGKWMKLSRTIDRDNDVYHEVIADPDTGEIVHECKERLSQHLGHGSDKRDRKEKNS